MNTQNFISAARRILGLEPGQDIPPLTTPQDPEVHGYEPRDVGWFGMVKAYPQHCRYETNRECGCAVGKCAKMINPHQPAQEPA